MTYDGEVLRPLERTEWEQREVYAKFGLAIYFCQVLEAGLVTYLVLLRLTDGAVRPTGEEVDDLYAKLFGNTLGRNLGNIRRLFGEKGGWVLEGQMADVLVLRNELAHSWMRERVLRQGTSENRLAMIEELERASALLQEANRLLTERTQELMANAGVPEDLVRDELQRLMGLGERGDDDPDAPDYFSFRQA